MKSSLCKRKAMKKRLEKAFREQAIEKFELSIIEAGLYPDPDCKKCYGRGYRGRDVKTNLMKPCRCLGRREITQREVADTYASPPIIDPTKTRIINTPGKGIISRLLWWITFGALRRFIYLARLKKESKEVEL